MEKGKLTIFIGPMFAGKTTALINKIKTGEENMKSCVVFKFDQDNRFSETQIVSHNNETHEAIPTDTLMKHYEKCKNYEIIGIDEGQFFEDICEFTQKMVNRCKKVYITALDGTFQRKPFGKILELLSLSQSFTKMHAIVHETGEKASFSKRIVNSSQVILIGSDDIYKPATRSIFFERKIDGDISLFICHDTTKREKFINETISQFSHGGKAFLVNKESELPLTKDLNEYDAVICEDVHRFPHIGEFADELANMGKHVFLSSLDCDDTGKTFDNIISLIPLCEYVEKQN